MKKHLVTMHCGQEMPANSPAQRFCNKQCSGYFVSRYPNKRRLRKAEDGEGQRVTPYLCGLASDDPAWNSAKRYPTRKGYMLLSVYDPVLRLSFQRMEHIVIWEKVNGEPVPKGWVIHHLNEQPDDNDPANLLAMPLNLHRELHVQLSHLKLECVGLEYLKRRYLLTSEFIKRATELVDLRRSWYGEKGE